MKREKSIQDYQKAKKFIPGGVNSPVRAFKAVRGEPVFIQRAEGAYLDDIDGNRYLDFIGTWGPGILGHSPPQVVKALKKTVEKGVSFGLPSVTETELAELICNGVPGIDLVRFVNSGTEAAMTAVRIARAYTKKDKIIKFEGCYHGHSDGLLVEAGSGGATLGVPSSSGVPSDCTQNTIVLPYNDLSSLQEVLEKEEVAGVMVEPVAGNMGVIVPRKEYIKGMRDLCTQNGVLLIMDEVMSGFRVHEQGAQGYFGVEGDLICLGKIIGGGLPVGAVGGKYELMSFLSPQGKVYQAGTLSGNPLAMTAGLTTLQVYYKNKIMDKIQSLSSNL
ncbi:glutamate-1-semialdehyde 2,1-aminomutase, partial [bacterium]|nr:glutamate-1-semialdehyde 2,1-aminomutase [bacterium]